MSGLNFFTSFICPLFGTLLCLTMWISPFPAVRNAIATQSLGSLNPTPFAIAIVNCLGWVMYSVIQKDYFIYFANVPGLILGIYYAINSMMLIALNNKGKELPKEYRILEVSLVFGPLLYALVTLIVGISLPNSQQNTGRILVAICANCCTVMYYASPLTTMYLVITTRDSSSLYPPMLLANLANSSMWLIYGLFALNDPFVYAPNGIGALLSGLQLTLSFIYPKKINTTKVELKDEYLEHGSVSNSLHAGSASISSSVNGDSKCRGGSIESFSIETEGSDRERPENK